MRAVLLFDKKLYKGKNMQKIEETVKPYDQNFTTMVPTGIVKFFRTCVVWQAIRFVAINIKMIAVVAKSH